MTTTISGVFTCCLCTSTSAGQSWPLAPLFPRPGMNTCCPTVRCGYLFVLPTIEYLFNIRLSSFCLCFLRSPLLYRRLNSFFFRPSDPHHRSQSLLRPCLAEAWYFLTGKEIYPTVQDSHLPFNITSHPERPILGKSRDRMVTSVRLDHQPLLLPESDYAMRSGWRQDTKFCTNCAMPVNTIRDKA